MTSDRELLQRYAQSRDETAFTELVQRHLPAVYAAALRLGGGDAHLAQDVAQAAFTLLANRAWTLTEHATLAGWLHTTTRYLAHKALREERRRRNRQQEAVAMQEQDSAPESNFESLRPLLDEAVGALREDERNALLLRFFHGKSHQEVAATLGLRENTANKRIERALEKLRRNFTRRGITTTLALLASAMETQAAGTLPAGLAAQVAKTSLAGTTAGGGTFQILWKSIFMSTKFKIIATAMAVAIIAAIPVVIQYRQITELKASLAQGVAGAKATGKQSAATLGDNLARLKNILAIRDSLEMMQRLTAFVVSLDAGSITPLLDYLVQPQAGNNLAGSGSNSSIAMSLMIDRQVHLSPATALKWEAAIPNRLGHDTYIKDVFAVWGAINPHEALAQASQIQDARLRQAVIGQIARAIIASNPAEALAALAEMPLNNAYFLALSQSFTEWASQDPKAALAGALQLPANRNRDMALESVIRAWTGNDPQGLLAWAGTQGEGATRNTAIKSAIGTLSKEDPVQAMGLVANLTNVSLRSNLTVSIAGEWAQDDPKSAADWVLQNTGGDTLRKSLKSIIDPLSSTDPQSAVALLTKMPGGGGTQIAAVQEIAKNWAEIDPQADLNWLKYLNDNTGTGPVSAVKSAAETNVVATWAKNDPNAALAYVESLGQDNPLYNAMITGIASARASLDPVSAADWIESIPNTDARNAAITNVMTQMVSAEPQLAVGLAKTLPPGPAQDAAFGKVISTWTAIDPSAAADSLALLQPGPALTSATQTVAANWIQSDPEAAGKWINSLPQGDPRDVAAREESKALTGVDFSAAFNWATSITDVQMRAQQGRAVAVSWARTDPVAAAAAVQGSNLTDLGKSRILAVIQRSGPAQETSAPQPGDAGN